MFRPPPTPYHEIPSLVELYKSKLLSPPPPKTSTLPASDKEDASGISDTPATDTPANSLASVAHKISLWSGDITQLAIPAIVNAANKTLLGGGGVDGAIHRAAGPGLRKECATYRGCDTGDAKITDAYLLPSDKVIHTVGPIYGLATADVTKETLASCYRNSLRLAVENDCRAIAFPCISTGAYRFPNRMACRIALETVESFLRGPMGANIDRVIFVTFLEQDMEIYHEILPKLFPPPPETELA